MEGESYLDLTAGYGGHATKVLERTLSPERATLVDRDKTAVDYLGSIPELSKSEIIHQDFLSASLGLQKLGKRYDIILADLGVSSLHLDIASRGFSIKTDGPLDMRMDQDHELTAKTIVNSYSEVELVKLLQNYGEELKARAIAKKIVKNRPFDSTHQLASIVASAWPGHSKTHPATKTFQALRIEVNDELGQLEAAMRIWMELLAPGGRIVIISFHSLEDRLVKSFLQEHAGDRYDASLRLLTKKPVSASKKELVSNPRARSAKLRAAVKINTKRKG